MGEPRRDFRLFPGQGSGGAEAELLRTPGEESAAKTFVRPQSKKMDLSKKNCQSSFCDILKYLYSLRT